MLLALWLLSPWVQAGVPQQDAIAVDLIAARPLPLYPYLAILEDPQHTLTLAQVQSRIWQGRFNLAPDSRQELNLGVSRSVFWLRFKLKNQADQPITSMLELATPNLDSVQLYQDETEPALVDTGQTLPFASRAWPNRFFVLPLTLPAHSEHWFYLRLHSNAPIKVPLKLWQRDAFREHQRNDYAVQGWVFGIMLVLATYNLLIFSNLRDVIYLQYVIFASALGLALASNQGLAAEFLWPNVAELNHVANLLCPLLAIITLLMMMQRLLDPPLLIRQTLKWLRLSHLGLALLLMAALPNPLFALTLLQSATALLVLGCCGWCVLRRHRNAGFFSIACLALTLPLGMAFFRTLQWFLELPRFDHGLSWGAALCLLLLSFALVNRVKLMRDDQTSAQQQCFQAQQNLVENLQSSERVLEQSVMQRTAALLRSHQALSETNAKLVSAWTAAQKSRQQAQQAQDQAALSLDHLCSAQMQLVQLEKMAALGQLIANVAHEINTPIGAIKSSGRTIADTLNLAMTNMVQLFLTLDQDSLTLFLSLLAQAQPTLLRSTREERSQTRKVAQALAAQNIAEPQLKANLLVQLNVHTRLEEFLPLLSHREAKLILKTANNIASVISSSNNINIAVERMDKIIFTLNSFSQTDMHEAMLPADVRLGMDTILGIYRHLIRQGCEVQRDYEEVPQVYCVPEQLNQVWTNLIHNALQAMQYQGLLGIAIRQRGAEVVVSISDSGCGIPEAIRERIFDAFFTTKAVGEGSGLGLSIIKTIIERHHGRIEVESTVGRGTTFSVFLPALPEPAGSSDSSTTTPSNSSNTSDSSNDSAALATEDNA